MSFAASRHLASSGAPARGSARASPALSVAIRRFDRWQLALGGLCAAAAGALGGWFFDADAAPGALRVALAAAGLAAIAAAASTARRAPLMLRWDTQTWSIGATDDDAITGTLSVAVDLEGWMLLRFVEAGRRRSLWIPVQRRGLEAEWHTLRCAVYAQHAGPAPLGQ